ncbi:hypothetical protein GCM10023176_33140 [Micromonospora coerulea]|uniref:Peptidase C39-like domain-containing protein n=1 Tax=Micromonospora coerulea TaxID=47856 RepID=A0ABP8SLR0_9ACTN
MKATLSRSLSVGLLVTGTILGPATTAQATPAQSGPVNAVQSAPTDAGKRVLAHDYQRQPNSYFCAPAATRIALSTQGKILSQQQVANKLGTTKAGTSSANETTRVLNDVTGGGYETTEINGPTAQAQQVAKLRADVVEAIDAKRGVVANITGTAVDTEGAAHTYPEGHYLTIIGYRNGGETLQIADPYARDGHYWMSDQKVADWVAERGYSS